MACALCDRVQKIKDGQYPFLIQELKHSYFLLGEHQYYKGYCLVLLKEHHREMTDLAPEVAQELFRELMLVHQAIQNVLQPKKMNMCSLGNVVPHVHWHFFPRYENDPHFHNPPWLQMQHFDSVKTDVASARELMTKLKMELKNLSSSVS